MRSPRRQGLYRSHALDRDAHLPSRVPALLARARRVASAEAPWRPTRAQLSTAAGRKIPDLIAPGLRVLFVGINPGLWSGAVGHHFARPGNRFWPVLHRAGFTPRVLSPFEERALLDLGCGITNLVARATASAAELTSNELVRGARRLERQIRRHQPGVVAFLGLSAYRIARNRPAAAVGECPERIDGSRVWLLPNPSGLNAHYQIPGLTRLYAALRREAFGDARPPG